MSVNAPAALDEVRRREFPHLDGIFLNTASFGVLPRRTVAAVERVLRLREEGASFVDYDIPGELDRCRRAAAALIGADAAEIALGPNTSFGLYLAATLLPQVCRESGRSLERATVLVSDREFPANVLPWLGLRRLGVRAEVLPSDEDGFPREDLMMERLRRGDVALLAVSAVQFASGYRADLARLGAACRENGALFVVDAIQAAGAQPIDVRAADIDVLACGGQKWLCAPQGCGFAYVRRELCERLEPAFAGWLSTTAAEDFNDLLNYGAPLLEDARRFELGSPGTQDFVGFSESLELLLEVGVDAIAAHIESLLDPLHDFVRERRGVRLASPGPGARASAIVSLRLEHGDTLAVYERLAQKGVACALREGTLRFSPHFYNTEQETESLVSLLDESI